MRGFVLVEPGVLNALSGGFTDKYLTSASSFNIDSLLEQAYSLDRLFVPAHIDRTVFGIIAQLGFLPVEDFDAVELAAHGIPKLAGNYPVLRNSDSHQISSIGAACSEFLN